MLGIQGLTWWDVQFFISNVLIDLEWCGRSSMILIYHNLFAQYINLFIVRVGHPRMTLKVEFFRCHNSISNITAPIIVYNHHLFIFTQDIQWLYHVQPTHSPYFSKDNYSESIEELWNKTSPVNLQTLRLPVSTHKSIMSTISSLSNLNYEFSHILRRIVRQNLTGHH